MEALVSIIVPIYNVERYLDNCIRSAAEQTYKNLEILLLDDGSRDGSAAICDGWQEKDSRIRVIHKKNEGVAATRNLGLREAKGDFVAFLDSDDQYSLDFIASLMEAMTDDVDIVVSHTQVMKPDMSRTIFAFADGSGKIGPEEAVRRLVKLTGMYNCLWDKLYRRRVLEDIHFPDGKIYEDCARSYQIIGKARAVAYAEKAMYYYRPREGSITWQPYGKRNLELIEQWLDRYRDIRRDWPSIAADANMAYLAELVIAWRSTAKYARQQQAEEMCAIILDCWRQWRAIPNEDKGMDWVNRSFLHTGRFSLRLICWMLNLIHYEFRDVASW